MPPIRDPRSIKRDEGERHGDLAYLRSRGLDIRLFCLACDRTVVLDTDDLIARHGAATPVQQIYDRARCTSCGRQADQMQVADRLTTMAPRRNG